MTERDQLKGGEGDVQRRMDREHEADREFTTPERAREADRPEGPGAGRGASEPEQERPVRTAADLPWGEPQADAEPPDQDDL